MHWTLQCCMRQPQQYCLVRAPNSEFVLEIKLNMNKDTLIQQKIFSIIKINTFRGELAYMYRHVGHRWTSAGVIYRRRGSQRVVYLYQLNLRLAKVQQAEER